MSKVIYTEDEMKHIKVFRFEFKDEVDGKNPFDAILREIGLPEERLIPQVDSIVLTIAMPSYRDIDITPEGGEMSDKKY